MTRKTKHSPRQLSAFCWARGKIEIKAKQPPGSILICTGPARQVKEVIEALARHAYDGKTMLVPGVPEASLLKQNPLVAVCEFIRRVNYSLGRRIQKTTA